MGLQNRLDTLKKDFTDNIPDDVLAIMNQETDALVASKIVANAIQVGQTLPNGTLLSESGKSVTIDQLMDGKPLVINFYRGGWCPYCNLELTGLEEVADDIRALGANIIAMSPESVDHINDTKNKNGVSFSMFSDEGSKFSNTLGLVFTLPKVLQDIYLTFGIDVEKHNGESRFELPIPATIIVKPNREVVYIYADGDYTQRSEPGILLSVLKSLTIQP